MCGIAGIYNLDGQEVDERRLQAMVAQIQHRGPDGSGISLQNATGLAHARLSLLDLAHGGQPMQTRDGRLTISFNGEIFNHVELRRDLQSRGHVFQTRSDTEVILLAYAEFGPACVHRFNGQWAFAIWDRTKRRLFLSRDRFGIRPLFFTQVGHQFLFASEVKALLVHPGVVAELDPIGMTQMFTVWSPVAPRTIFRDVRELPPAHNMTVRPDRLSISRYWELDFSPDTQPIPLSQQIDELDWLLRDATRIRLQADVPVGAYLSGGLDSSITTALAKREIGDSLHTFSIAFEDPEFDESRHQQTVVDQLATRHTAVRCGNDDLARVFPAVVWHAEKPLLRTAPAPLYLLAQLVRQTGLKAVVTGEGADECFGGYDIFKEAKIRRFCARQPESSRRANLLRRLYPYLPFYQSQSNALRQAFFKVTPASLRNPLFSHLPRWEMSARIERFFSPDFIGPGTWRGVLENIADALPPSFSHWHHFSQAQYLEATVLLPGYILSSQGDRMAMAHSVEGRFPFLDHRVAELAARLPARWKTHGTSEKHLLKKTFANQVPPETIRRVKQPYRAPGITTFFDSDRQAFRADYAEQLLATNRLREDGIFEPRAVAHLERKIRVGRATGTRDDMALTAILSTQLLIEQFIRNMPRIQHTCDSPCRLPGTESQPDVPLGVT